MFVECYDDVYSAVLTKFLHSFSRIEKFFIILIYIG